MLIFSTIFAIAIFSISAWKIEKAEAVFSEALRDEICRNYEFRQALKLLHALARICQLLVGAAAFFAIMIGLGHLLDHGPKDGFYLAVLMGGFLGASLCHGLGWASAQVEIYSN